MPMLPASAVPIAPAANKTPDIINVLFRPIQSHSPAPRKGPAMHPRMALLTAKPNWAGERAK